VLKVVLDTNIFVSAFLTKGDCARIVRMWEKGKFILITSTEILKEIVDVLTYLGAPRHHTSRLLKLVQQKARLVEPYLKVNVSRHSADNKFLECAIEGNAEVIVSGDDDLKVIGEYKGIRIISIRYFLDNFAQLG